MGESLNLVSDSVSLVDSIKDNYDTFNLYNEKDREKEAEKEKVNGIFYRISETFCYMLTNINIIDFDELDLKKFYTEINENAQIFIQINTNLSLDLKGHYSFLSIIKFIEFLLKSKQDEKEIKKLLKVFVKYIFDEKTFIFAGDVYSAKKALNEQINITIKLSDELSSKIFVNKLLQYTKFEDYQLKLIKTLFQYPHLIKFSFLFFNYIFLSLPIKPKKQLEKNMLEVDKRTFLDKFWEIKDLKKNNILKEINTQAENNKILKEIIL